MSHALNYLQLQILQLEQKYEQVNDLIILTHDMLDSLKHPDIVVSPEQYAAHVGNVKTLINQIIEITDEIVRTI